MSGLAVAESWAEGPATVTSDVFGPCSVEGELGVKRAPVMGELFIVALLVETACAKLAATTGVFGRFLGSEDISSTWESDGGILVEARRACC